MPVAPIYEDKNNKFSVRAGKTDEKTRKTTYIAERYVEGKKISTTFTSAPGLTAAQIKEKTQLEATGFHIAVTENRGVFANLSVDKKNNKTSTVFGWQEKFTLPPQDNTAPNAIPNAIKEDWLKYVKINDRETTSGSASGSGQEKITSRVAQQVFLRGTPVNALDTVEKNGDKVAVYSGVQLATAQRLVDIQKNTEQSNTTQPPANEAETQKRQQLGQYAQQLLEVMNQPASANNTPYTNALAVAEMLRQPLQNSAISNSPLSRAFLQQMQTGRLPLSASPEDKAQPPSPAPIPLPKDTLDLPNDRLAPWQRGVFEVAKWSAAGAGMLLGPWTSAGILAGFSALDELAFKRDGILSDDGKLKSMDWLTSAKKLGIVGFNATLGRAGGLIRGASSLLSAGKTVALPWMGKTLAALGSKVPALGQAAGWVVGKTPAWLAGAGGWLAHGGQKVMGAAGQLLQKPGSMLWQGLNRPPWVRQATSFIGNGLTKISRRAGVALGKGIQNIPFLRRAKPVMRFVGNTVGGLLAKLPGNITRATGLLTNNAPNFMATGAAVAAVSGRDPLEGGLEAWEGAGSAQAGLALYGLAGNPATTGMGNKVLTGLLTLEQEKDGIISAWEQARKNSKPVESELGVLYRELNKLAQPQPASDPASL